MKGCGRLQRELLPRHTGVSSVSTTHALSPPRTPAASPPCSAASSACLAFHVQLKPSHPALQVPAQGLCPPATPRLQSQSWAGIQATARPSFLLLQCQSTLSSPSSAQAAPSSTSLTHTEPSSQEPSWRPCGSPFLVSSMLPGTPSLYPVRTALLVGQRGNVSSVLG